MDKNQIITISSDEDLKIYNDNNHIRIFAGPGAGKTRLLIENIKYIVQNSNKLKNSDRKILCITYTNSAVDEIKKRLGSYSKYVVVATIHSFINEYILSPNQIQLKMLTKELFKINVAEKVKLSSVKEGFTTLTGIKKEDIFSFITSNYADISETQFSSLSKRKMSECSIDIKPVNQTTSTGCEQVAFNSEEIKLDSKVIKAIKDFTWSVAGNLTFDETLFFGMKLVKHFNLIKYMLRVEFPYIFVDEYQDTNPIQNIIIKDVAAKGCILCVIGDIAQSIYSFQGATYLDFYNFKINSSIPVKDYIIENNRRSTENIIKFNNFIRKSDPNIERQKCAKNFDSNDKVTFIIQKSKNIPLHELNVIDYSQSVVLCRRWADVFTYIKDIDKAQLKLLSSINNTYSYVLKRDLFTEIEAQREFWIDSAVIIAKLEDAMKRKCIPTAISVLQRFMKVKDFYSSNTKESIDRFCNFIRFWEDNFTNIDGGLLLKDLILEINKNMLSSGLEIIELLPYPEKDSEEYYINVYKDVDKLYYATARKMAFELFSKDGKYMTIHKSKGREFNEVIVSGIPFKSESDLGIALEKTILSPIILSNKSASENSITEEFTRILYVGFSRAINKLYVHLYGDEILRSQIDIALKEYNGSNDDFYDFIIC